MPAIPVIAAGIAYIGVSTAVATFVATVITYAVVGAAIGGLTAAITGGSIGKGILFGAIGGAVTGGIGAWASAGSTAASGGVTGATSVGASEAAAAGQVGASAAGSTTAASAGGGYFASTQAASTGLTQGEGLIGSALVTAGGSALAGAFDDSAEIAAKEKQADREASERLAKLQAETQLKIAEMQAGGGSSSNGDARYTADLQLQNAREQRAQDYKLKQEEYSLLEAQRSRRAEAAQGIMAARDAGSTPPANAKSVDQQVYENANQMYAKQQPAPPQNVNNTQQPGVMQEPVYA